MLTARRPLGGRNNKEERLGKSGAEYKAGRSERFRLNWGPWWPNGGVNSGSRSPKTEAPRLGNWRLSLPTELQNAGGDARGEDPGGQVMSSSGHTDLEWDMGHPGGYVWPEAIGKGLRRGPEMENRLEQYHHMDFDKDPAVLLTHPREEGQFKKPQARREPGVESVLLLLSFLWSPNPSHYLSLPGEMFACPWLDLGISLQFHCKVLVILFKAASQLMNWTSPHWQTLTDLLSSDLHPPVPTLYLMGCNLYNSFQEEHTTVIRGESPRRHTGKHQHFNEEKKS